MAEEDRKDEEEEWETEEHIVGVSNIYDDEFDWEEILGQNIIPEEYEVDEHNIGVNNIGFNDSPIYAFPIERNNFLEEQEKIEEEFET